MRIALLNPRPQRRGGELFSRQLAEALGRRGHDLLEIYLYPHPGDDGLPPSAVELHLSRSRRPWPERLFGSDPRIAKRLAEALAGFDAEVVQASGGKTVRYAAQSLGARGRRPLLVYRNIGQPDLWLRGRLRRRIYSRRVFPRVGAVATVARAFVPRLEQLCPDARVVRCIPGGVDPRRLEPTVGRERTRRDLGAEPDAPVALFAGALSPEKRVDRLLRAFRAGLDREPAATLWIAGGGGLDGTLRALAAELGLEDRARFLGSRADVGDLIAASDLVCLSSDTEGVPGILLEAAALGRPVVATRAGATAEAVVDGETGLLVDRDDSPALARALFDLLTDAERRRRMGEAAAVHFRRASLSIEAAAEAYEALYRDALGRAPEEAAV